MAEGIKHVDDQNCEKCPTTALLPENEEAARVISLADPYLWRSGGAADMAAVITAMTEAGVEDYDRVFMIEKVTAWISLCRAEIKSKAK